MTPFKKFLRSPKIGNGSSFSNLSLLYPTLNEGFGLPALEAQASGTPALFSYVDSLNEIAGPAAHVLPVEDLAAWSGALDALSIARAPAVPLQSARDWARAFSWAETAERTLDVLRRTAVRKPPILVKEP